MNKAKSLALAWPTLALATSLSFAQTPSDRIHPQLLQLHAGDTARVIVIHRAGAAHGAGPRIQARTGVEFRNHFDSVAQSSASLSEQDIKTLSMDPEVEYVAPDSPVKAFALDKGPDSVGAYAALSAGFSGSGIGVAVIDSGVSYLNCDFGVNCGSATRYAAQISFVNNLNGSWTAPDDGEDYFGHGTHVASILAGVGTFSTSYVNQWNIFPFYAVHGVAPGAHIVSERVLDNTGAGSDSSVIAAIDWAIANKAQYNIRVINLSLGRPFTTSYQKDPLCQAAEAAWKAGIVVVVAAGNYGRDGYGTVTAPGNDPLVITVGAVNTRGTTDRTQHVVTSYSSKGPTGIDHIVKPDLVAPGNNIYATQCVMPGATSGKTTACPLIKTYAANMVVDTDYASATYQTADNWYFRLSGTSMATPVVSGAVAILLQQTPHSRPTR